MRSSQSPKLQVARIRQDNSPNYPFDEPPAVSLGSPREPCFRVSVEGATAETQCDERPISAETCSGRNGEGPPVTPEMIEAGLWEFDARFPDVVFVGDDGERLVLSIFLAMDRASQNLHGTPR